MAIYHLNHRSVGKQTHAPGTAAAAVRYLTRRSACERIDAVGGVANHPKALEREAQRQEETSRKNARVCDKFVISLPREMSVEQRVAVTRSFLIRLSQNGRARAFACYHGQGTQNPHVHVMFFDRDTESGRRVQRMSEPGSTERIRLMWQEICNNHLERGGFEDRIDHRSLAVIEAERQADSLEAVAAPEDEPVADIQEADASPSIDYAETPFSDRDPIEKIGFVFTLDDELQDVQRTVRDFRRLNDRLPQDHAKLEHHAQASSVAAGEAALARKKYAETLAEFRRDHQVRDGSLKGFEVTIGGVTLFRSQSRDMALHKREELKHTQEAMVAAQEAAEFHRNARQTAGQRLRETNEQLGPLEHLMRSYGSVEDAELLAKDMKSSRDFALDHLQHTEIEDAAGRHEITPDHRERLYKLKFEREQELAQDAGNEGISY